MTVLEYTLPDVGEGLGEAEIVRWHVRPGDRVAEDQTLVEVQTDKSLVEIPAPCDGVVERLGADEGDILQVGEVLAVIAGEGAGASRTPPREDRAVVATGQPARVLASPSTRRAAVGLGVDVRSVTGTGPNGRVTRSDVEQASGATGTPEARTVPPPAGGRDAAPRTSEPDAGDKVVALRGLRRQIARTMTAALAIPAITEWRDVDATQLLRTQRRLREHLEPDGVRLTLLALVVKAAVAALRRHPGFNARFDPEREELTYRSGYHLGLATATPEGLIVPVLRDADGRSLPDVAREIERLADAARSRRIAVGDTADGTFTISNYGSFGTRSGVPIIRPPEVAIAGIGRVHDKVIAVGGNVVVRAVLPLTVSTDHRVNDGSDLAAFCDTLERYLADPVLLLTEPG